MLYKEQRNNVFKVLTENNYFQLPGQFLANLSFNALENNNDIFQICKQQAYQLQTLTERTRKDIHQPIRKLM